MITIGISTIEKKFSSLLEQIKEDRKLINENIKFLIVVQVEKFQEIEFIEPIDGVKIIFSTTKGLSFSRNLVIKNVITDWIWFQDDDINLNYKELNEFYHELNDLNESDLIFTQIGSLENKNQLYKNYAFHDNHKSLNALKISSIEILVKKSLLVNYSISFDTELGLGTSLPCCEENYFIWECLKKTNKVIYSNRVLCFHTTLPENRTIDYQGRYRARGYFLNKIPLYFSIPLFIRWIIRRSEVNRIEKIGLLIKGYVIDRHG